MKSKCLDCDTRACLFTIPLLSKRESNAGGSEADMLKEGVDHCSQPRPQLVTKKPANYSHRRLYSLK